MVWHTGRSPCVYRVLQSLISSDLFGESEWGDGLGNALGTLEGLLLLLGLWIA